MLRALSRHALCFVHADAKGEISGADVREMNGIPNVRAIRRYKVNWGSVYHLYALCDLVRLALEDPRVTHLHLISAQDFPCVPWREMERFFDGDSRIHMQYLRTADYPELSHRYRHFHFMHLLNYRDMSAQELADYILEKAGILVVPGTGFGEGGEKCIRLSFAADKTSLQEAVRRLGELFAQ